MKKGKRKSELITISLQEFESLMDKHKKQMRELQAERDQCEQLRERYELKKSELIKWIETFKTMNDKMAENETALAELMDDDFYEKL